MKLRLTYLAVFLIILSVLAFLPKTGGYIWQPEIINPLSALLFTLLVYLTGHIARSTQSAAGVLCTAMFVLLFCPDSHEFFNRDETAVMTLSSTCIVPFFISQYTRISNKNFKYGYFLMLLMGIFCSYTHDSITIPLCASFLTLSYLQRDRLFRLACWPMVIGFAIGTTLCLLQSTFWKQSSWSDLTALSSQTADGFTQLWETKVFMFATLLTIISCLHGKTETAMAHLPRAQASDLLPVVFFLRHSFCSVGNRQCHLRRMFLLHVLGIVPVPTAFSPVSRTPPQETQTTNLNGQRSGICHSSRS